MDNDANGSSKQFAVITGGSSGIGLEFADVRNLVETNVIGTLDLLHRVGGRMLARGAGRILITGSIAGLIPGGRLPSGLQCVQVLHQRLQLRVQE